MTGYVWDDDLIWCPSQCYCSVKADNGSRCVLYLRWRWEDPWQGTIVSGAGQENITDGDWHDVDIGHWRDDQLNQAKTALITTWEASSWKSGIRAGS